MSEYTEAGLMRLGSRELARRFLINERVRKHWRILAIKASLNQIKPSHLKQVCFREMMGIVPEDAEMDPELKELVDLLESWEGDEEGFRKLGDRRVIDLADDDL